MAAPNWTDLTTIMVCSSTVYVRHQCQCCPLSSVKLDLTFHQTIRQADQQVTGSSSRYRPLIVGDCMTNPLMDRGRSPDVSMVPQVWPSPGFRPPAPVQKRNAFRGVDLDLLTIQPISRTTFSRRFSAPCLTPYTLVDPYFGHSICRISPSQDGSPSSYYSHHSSTRPSRLNSSPIPATTPKPPARALGYTNAPSRSRHSWSATR